MQNAISRSSKVVFGLCVAMPMILSTIVAYAGNEIGGGNPACIIAGTTVTACSKVDDDSNCEDDFIEDGDCPSITFATAGLTGPPSNFTVACKYYKMVVGDNGCERDGDLRTYNASCSQPAGTSCPAP
jgi:hypothetical protein